MDNKTEYFTLKEDGVIVWIENMPKEPIKRESFESYAGTVYMGGDFGYEKAYAKYQQALQSAISNATEVSNSDEVARRINESKEGHRSVFESLDYGRVYLLQCHVSKLPDSITSKPLALVTFPEPEEDDDDIRGYPEGDERPEHWLKPSSGVEETQEELSELTKHFYTDDNPWRDIYMDFKEGEGWLNFTERMSKQFTIIRKNK